METANDSRPINLEESVDIALKDVRGKVVMLFPRPVPHVVFAPQGAFDFAENLARAAHRARFPGDRVPNDFHYLAQQIKQRLTEEMRDRLIVRLRAMLPSALESKDLGYVSRQVVDTVFAAIDDEGRFGL
jgi:hypothetical protein